MLPSEAVLFSDLDGTLFHDDGYVSKENIEAIERFIAAGGKFAISTGRIPSNAMPMLKGVPINAPSVVINGAAAYDSETGIYSECCYLDRTICDPLFRWTIENIPNVDIQIYTEDGINYVTPREHAQPDLLALHLPCNFVKLDDLNGKSIFKALVLALEPYKEKAEAKWLNNAEGHYSCVPGISTIGNPTHFLEILPLGINKGITLNKLREHPKLKGRTFIAIGDYWNDYELLKEADIAVCPENAIPEVKEICDYITVSCNDHAIRATLEDLLPSMKKSGHC